MVADKRPRRRRGRQRAKAKKLCRACSLAFIQATVAHIEAAKAAGVIVPTERGYLYNPDKQPRSGWGPALAAMAAAGDDKPIIPDLEEDGDGE